MPFNVNAIEF